MSELAARAREAAEEAHVLFDAALFSGACSRACYAMFNAARALLLAKGYAREQSKTHKTVLRLFSSEFVQSGRFDPDLARALRRAADARHMAEYEGGVGREEAAQVMRSLDEFMRAADAAFAQIGGSEDGR